MKELRCCHQLLLLLQGDEAFYLLDAKQEGDYGQSNRRGQFPSFGRGHIRILSVKSADETIVLDVALKTRGRLGRRCASR